MSSSSVNNSAQHAHRIESHPRKKGEQQQSRSVTPRHGTCVRISVVCPMASRARASHRNGARWPASGLAPSIRRSPPSAPPCAVPCCTSTTAARPRIKCLYSTATSLHSNPPPPQLQRQPTQLQRCQRRNLQPTVFSHPDPPAVPRVVFNPPPFSDTPTSSHVQPRRVHFPMPSNSGNKPSGSSRSSSHKPTSSSSHKPSSTSTHKPTSSSAHKPTSSTASHRPSASQSFHKPSSASAHKSPSASASGRTPFKPVLTGGPGITPSGTRNPFSPKYIEPRSSSGSGSGSASGSAHASGSSAHASAHGSSQFRPARRSDPIPIPARPPPPPESPSSRPIRGRGAPHSMPAAAAAASEARAAGHPNYTYYNPYSAQSGFAGVPQSMREEDMRPRSYVSKSSRRQERVPIPTAPGFVPPHILAHQDRPVEMARSLEKKRLPHDFFQ